MVCWWPEDWCWMVLLQMSVPSPSLGQRCCLMLFQEGRPRVITKYRGEHTKKETLVCRILAHHRASLVYVIETKNRTLYHTPKNVRRKTKTLWEGFSGRWKSDVLRPGECRDVGMRGSMVVRLRPCMTMSNSPRALPGSQRKKRRGGGGRGSKQQNEKATHHIPKKEYSTFFGQKIFLP